MYAVTGGLKLKVEREKSAILVDGSILTPSGVKLMSTCGYLPEINIEAIRDQSKEDHFAKGFACCQAGWMFIQIIARAASHLPITMLELNTVAHIACAIVLFVVWWLKPKDVTVPQTVQVPDCLAAIMSEETEYISVAPYQQELAKEIINTSRECQPQPVLTELEVCQRDIVNAGWSNLDLENPSPLKLIRSPQPDTKWKRLSPYEKGRRIQKAKRSDGVAWLLPGDEPEGYPCKVSQALHLTNQQIEKFLHLADLQKSDEYHILKTKILESFPNPLDRHFLLPSAPNLVRERQPRITFLLLSVLSVVYAGIHASSWNEHFPTEIERTLWHISVCFVAGGGFLLWAVLQISWSITIRQRRLKGGIAPEMLFVLGKVAGTCFTICSLVFGTARAFLAIESFISLRSLPYGSYMTVNWVGFMPHFP
jgi:hypothetical protein